MAEATDGRQGHDAAPRLWVLLVRLLAVVFGGLGLLLVAWPEAGAALFGLLAEEDPALAYVRALGFRDLALCLYLLALSRLAPRAARALLGISVLIPAGDLTLLLLEAGASAPVSLALHALSGLCLVALAAWPWGRRDPGGSRPR